MSIILGLIMFKKGRQILNMADEIQEHVTTGSADTVLLLSVNNL